MRMCVCSNTTEGKGLLLSGEKNIVYILRHIGIMVMVETDFLPEIFLFFIIFYSFLLV